MYTRSTLLLLILIFNMRKYRYKKLREWKGAAIFSFFIQHLGVSDFTVLYYWLTTAGSYSIKNNRGRYHQEQSSQLITFKSQIFPVKNANLRSSGLVGLVAKSSVFKTRQLLLSSVFTFKILSVFQSSFFTKADLQTSQKPGYPSPHNLIAFPQGSFEIKLNQSWRAKGCIMASSNICALLFCSSLLFCIVIEQLYTKAR